MRSTSPGCIDRLRDEDQSLEDLILTLRAAARPTSAPPPTKSRSSTRASSPSSRSSSRTSKGCASKPRNRSAISPIRRTRVGELEEEIRDLDERLGGVSQERVALVQRLEAEERIREQFATIENLFGRDEARVSREGNRMIIRLVGLTFQSGARRRAARVPRAAREAAAGGRGVPALADRDRRAHRLVRRRRDQPRAVAPPRGSGQRVPDERARCAGVSLERGRLRRDAADREQRHASKAASATAASTSSSSRSSNPPPLPHP